MRNILELNQSTRICHCRQELAGVLPQIFDEFPGNNIYDQNCFQNFKKHLQF